MYELKRSKLVSRLIIGKAEQLTNLKEHNTDRGKRKSIRVTSYINTH